MTDPLIEIVRNIFNGFLVIVFVKVLIEYLYEHKEEIKNNWKGYK